MHILILPSWYPSEKKPLSGSFFAEQAAALARFGHTVAVMAVYNDGERGVQTEKRTSGNLTEYLIHVKPVRFSVCTPPNVFFFITFNNTFINIYWFIFWCNC